MSSRRVERLVIRAPDPSLVARGQALIEDALRTASVPGDDPSRVVFIRRLDLGVIRPEATPTQVSRALERELSKTPLRVVRPGELDSSSSVDAVVFDDPIAAGVELARRVARGGDTSGWLWPLVAAGFECSSSREEGLRCVLAAALDVEAPGLAAARIVSGLAEDGRLSALRGVLRPGEGDGLLQRCGWGEAGSRSAREPGGVAHQRIRPEAARGLETDATLSALSLLSRAWGADDARLTWAAAALALAKRPAWAALTDLASRARGWLEELPLRSAPGDASRTTPGGKDEAGLRQGVAAEDGRASRSALDADADVADTLIGHSSGATASGVDAGAGDCDLSEPRASAAVSAQPPGDEAASPRLRIASDDRGPVAATGRSANGKDDETEGLPAGGATSGRLRFTAHAGLFFLVPVLDRLGIAAALAAEPRWVELELPTRILLAAAERLGLPDDDPLREALVTAVPSPRFAEPGGEPCFEPGEVWRGLGLPQSVVHGIDPVVNAWLRAARLWCRRRAAIALHALVRRPGRVAVTPTHVDTCFDLSLIDMRVRRAALDIDPGFVPWLGRVLLFHYGDPTDD